MGPACLGPKVHNKAIELSSDVAELIAVGTDRSLKKNSWEGLLTKSQGCFHTTSARHALLLAEKALPTLLVMCRTQE